MITWRDGVQIEGTQIWCDAVRAREICFVSRADAIGRARHGQLVATAETLALLDSGQRSRKPETELPVPYGRPFTVGTTRLELLRSGHSVGAASLLVAAEGRRVLYAGAIDPRGGGLGGAAESRPCDAVVLSVEEDGAGESLDGAAARAIEQAGEVTRAGGAAVFLVPSPGRALDLAVRLAEAAIELAAHRAIHVAAQRLDRAGLPLPHLRRLANASLARAAGRALLWPEPAASGLDRDRLPAGSRLFRFEGASAGRDELAAFVEGCGARELYVTGRGAAELATALDGERLRARAVGPPVQMRLFG